MRPGAYEIPSVELALWCERKRQERLRLLEEAFRRPPVHVTPDEKAT